MQDQSAAQPSSFSLSNLCKYFSDLSPLAMVALEGEEHRVRHVNQAFLDLTGMEEAALIGIPFTEALSEGKANGASALLDRVYLTAIPEAIAEQKHGDADVVYWSYSVWAILGIDEKPAGVMVQIIDSSEVALFRTRAVAMNRELVLSALHQQEIKDKTDELNVRLQAAIREKEYFIAVLSHELRTPLNPVLIAAAILEKDERLDLPTREMMEMIHRNVRLEARLIDDLLDMTRMERGTLRLESRELDIHEVLESAIEANRSDIEGSGLRFEFDREPGRQTVIADPVRLHQVFSNILRNAVKSTKPPGSIHVRSYFEGGDCKVAISDSSVGMSAEFLSRAFDAFVQSDKTEAGKPGPGLGLAICKTIMELHRGSITAHSDGEGKGASFLVTLPAELRVEKIKYQGFLPRPNILSPVKPLRILVVEDNSDSAFMMRHLLLSDGHTVSVAEDIATGLELAETNDFDLLLSDLGLPDGTGGDLMRRLRQNGSTIPGIVLSGFGQDEDIARSREAGFAAHLVKPLDLEMLHDALSKVRND